jgi:hypothetical protein
MRRLLALLLVAGLTFIVSAPASAIDQETDARIKALEQSFGAWSLYGSARFETFYQSTDKKYDDGYMGLGLQPDNEVTQWALSPISRVGAKVNKGNLGARVEFGVNNSSPTTRLMYGTYKSGDLTIIFGRDWAPLSDWTVSNQQYYAENDLAGFGVIDKGRASQIKFRFKGLEVALVQPVTNDLNSSTPNFSAKVDVVLPTLEARYQLYLVPDKFFIQPFVGANTYKVEVAEGTKKDITPWTAGLNAGLNVKPVYLNAMGWYAQDGKQLGLNIADALGAYWDAVNSKVIDEKNMGFAVVAGVAIDKYTVEAGYGNVSSKWDSGPKGTDKDKAQSYYVNVTIPLVGDNFFVVPEVGVIDEKNDIRGGAEGNGKITYWGAKWELDF